jgi:hypothetical protein
VTSFVNLWSQRHTYFGSHKPPCKQTEQVQQGVDVVFVVMFVSTPDELPNSKQSLHRQIYGVPPYYVYVLLQLISYGSPQN